MKTSLTTLAIALAATSPAMAQDKSEGWTPDDIIVTGQKDAGYVAAEATTLRTPVSIQQTPQSVQVLTSALIKDQELNSIDEALANVSNVTPSHSSEMLLINPIVRGFEAEIFTDGLVGYGDTAVSDAASLWHVERVEVAKGPTSTLFGGGIGAPVGGLINQVTKTANFKTGFAARARAGSFDTYALAGDANVAFSDAAAIRLVGEVQSANDYIDKVNIDRILLAPSVRFQPSPDTDIIARVNYSRIKQLEYVGLPGVLRGVAGIKRDRFTSATNAPRSDIENFSASLEVTQRLSETVKANLRVRRYENRFDEYSASPYLAFFPCAGTFCAEVNAALKSDVGEWTADASLTAEVSTGSIDHVLLAGAQWDRVNYDGMLNFDLFGASFIDLADPASDINYVEPATIPSNISRYSTFALYAQDQMTIAQRFHLLASVRYSRMRINELQGGAGNDEVYHEINPRIGATVDLSEGVSLFAGYATGSRLSLFFNGTNAPLPEKSKSLEGGLKFALKDTGLSGTISAFRLTRSNVPTPDPFAFFTSIQTGKQRSTGVELDMIYEPSKSFSLLASYGYTNAKVVADTVIPVGTRLARVPKSRGRIAARYRFDLGLELGAGLTMVSKTWLAVPNTETAKGYTLADAQAAYSIGPARIGLRVDNLFNKKYFAPYAYYAQNVVRPGNPRSAYLTLGVNF